MRYPRSSYNHQLRPCESDNMTYAEKSALPVTALEASSDNFVDHTAPLCPTCQLEPNQRGMVADPEKSLSNHQSNSSALDFHPCKRKSYDKSHHQGYSSVSFLFQRGSTYIFENWRWTTGLVCPEHNRGWTLTGAPPGVWAGV
jgi:hypothetical protein